MSAGAWILIAFGVVAIGGGAMWFRNMLRKSREQQRQIDWSKIRSWEDEDEDNDRGQGKR